jgi:hypothetical protein
MAEVEVPFLDWCRHREIFFLRSSGKKNDQEGKFRPFYIRIVKGESELYHLLTWLHNIVTYLVGRLFSGRHYCNSTLKNISINRALFAKILAFRAAQEPRQLDAFVQIHLIETTY